MMADDKKTPLERYSDMVDRGELQPDAAQTRVVHQLDALYLRLSQPGFLERRQRRISEFLARWLKRKAVQHNNGIYLWGDVGRGKSMLMDLLYISLPFAQKRRVHFHRFMLEVHSRIHALRAEKKWVRDPLLTIASELAARYRVLCFDEFQVHDVADAMILSRLFTALFQNGMMIVFTSNRPPDDLYLGGLQRERFLPFISLLKNKTQVIELNAREDYRRSRMAALSQVYINPLGATAERFIRSTFAALQSGGKVAAIDVEVQGHTIHVQQACRDIALFSFDELCARPLAAPDYLALVALFRVFIVTNIPQMDPELRNEAKRFTAFIDVLYEHKSLLICSAEVPPEDLYAMGDGHFEFERTVSRLIEMQSSDYLEATAQQVKNVA
ncbi:MAG: AFG1 family ATPase [Rickettsiales bacterium]|nr:AFG1 family ATPase [Rickettsiales bacterium]